MKSRIFSALMLLVVGVVIALPQEASAVPVFARKYGFNCTMCHSSVPRLNDFGQRYRANGYRLMDRENQDQTVLESPAPVAFRTSAGYNGLMYNDEVGLDNASDFAVNGLDLLSAGLLGSKIGFFMIYTPQIAEQRGVAGQEGSLEMASVVFSNLGCSPWFNLRVGRFEPAYVPLSVKRELSVSPLEVYDMTFPEGPAFSMTQSGLELSGHGAAPFRYAAGIVGGSDTNRSIDSPSDVYGRVSYVVGPGEGQTAGQRIGVLGYMGCARPGGSGGKRESFYRFGADASLNVSMVNLAGQFLYGSDDKTLWPGSDATETEDVTWWGGFGELTVMPTVNLAGFARFDYVNMPDVRDQDVTRMTAGGRFYFEDNVALHCEISQRSVKAVVADADDAKETFVTARVDFAF
jgi:hypothetical protein